MSIQSEIDRVNGEVSKQSVLIDQIRSVLAEKVGGGGTSVETCTVSIGYESLMYSGYAFGTAYIDGSFVPVTNYTLARASIGSGTITLENVVCGSVLVLVGLGTLMDATGAISLYNGDVLQITAGAGETVDIICA